MDGIERSYILRTLAGLCIIGNLIFGFFKFVSDTWATHIIAITLAVPLLIGTHLIIKNFDPLKSDNFSTQREKEYQADKWFARLMFTWFGIVIGVLSVIFFFIKN